MDRRSIGLIGAVVALVLFFAVNVLANATLRTARVDLTAEKLFTLSEGSRSIARDLDEPIRLYLYVSQAQAREIPTIKDYADRVRDVLESYVLHADGNLILEVIDPEPFSEEEEEAVREGVAAIPLGTGDPLYFGLVGTNATDDREVIPFFDPFDQDKERFLEYDISRLIYSLAHPEKKKVAVLSSLPIDGGPPTNPFTPQPHPRWKFLDQLESFFDVEVLETDVEEIAGDVDVLLLVHPRDLGDATLYAIDQYVMRGGNLIAFVDPHCEEDQSANDPNNPMAQFGASRASDLNRLFQAWGFEEVPNKAVGDRQHALGVSINERNRRVAVDYVIWMRLGQESFDETDAITSHLDQIMMAAPGFLRPTPDAETEFTPLIQSSEDSMEIDVGRLQFQPDPKGLLASFVSGNQALTLAARISGPAKSAFASGKPGAATAAEEDDGHDHAGELEEDGSEAGTNGNGADGATGDEGAGDEAAGADGHLAASEGSIHVIAVADADMLADRWWVEEQRLAGLSLGFAKTSDNVDFTINAIENLLGGDELISIRARGRFSRPFGRVQELERAAREEHISQETELNRQLQEAQRRINKLQREKSPDSALILSPAQQEELAKLRAAEIETKRKLREVQHSLRKEIDGLGTRLKWLNIALIPVLVSAAAIALGAWRIQRRGT